MASLIELLSQQVLDGGLTEITGQLGTDEATTKRAVPAALGTLVGALAKNTVQPSGAAALSGALSRDHDGSILDDLAGALTGGSPATGGGATRGGGDVGAAILRHVLGGKQASVESGLGDALGLDSQSAGKLLTMLAPIVLGALGKAQRTNGLDAGGLAGILQGERKQVAEAVPRGSGLVASLLDQDGDGNVADDVARLGGGLLKKLFR